MKWLKAIAAAFVAVVAAFFISRASSHRKTRDKLARKIEDKQDEAGVFIKDATAEREKKEAAELRAKAALKEADARITQLKENGHESLADRVASRNKRLRNR